MSKVQTMSKLIIEFVKDPDNKMMFSG